MRSKLLAGFVAGAAFLAVPSAVARPMSLSDQRQAAQQHDAIVAQFGGAETGARAAYVQEVGRRVASQTALPGVGAEAYQFTVLNSPVLNAFAVPGGRVYITRQLLALMNDEAELASVLGHEVGHIAADHSAKRQRSSIFSQLGAAALGVLTGSGQVAQLAGQVTHGLVLSYSRGQEYQADDLGIRYIAGLRYDPAASADLLGSLGAAEALAGRASGGRDERALPSWARTHPLSADRVRRASQRAQSTGLVGRGTRNRDQLLAQLDGLVIDDDPRQGVVEGATFKHPDLRLRFTVPAGYQMQNGVAAVTITGSGGQAQFAGGSGGALDAYVTTVLRQLAGGQGVNAPALQRTSVNGIPAAFTTVRAQSGSTAVDATVFAYQFSPSSNYHFLLLTPAGSGVGPFRSLVGSLDRLGAAEAAAIRPRVIDVVTVGPRDTATSLAARMAYPDYRLERFRVLNGLGADEALRPGDKVKLVVQGPRT